MFNMFKMFKSTQSTPAVAPMPCVDNSTHVVRDNNTNKIIMRGSFDDCDQYRNAFGVCRVEEK